MLRRFSLVLAVLALLPPPTYEARADTPEDLGTVTFTTSCNQELEPEINRAVALMHSFQFAHAIEGFHAILARDPSCSMAYWGIALSNWGNPFSANLKSPAQLDQGLKAVGQGRAANPKTPRERAYIEAVAHLFTGSDSAGQAARAAAYADAMAAVSAAYPDDSEAAIFYALALAAAADPADKTYARQLQAGAILEKLFVRYPNHPGLAHYIIHAYDVAPLAGRAAEAARRYAAIAPSTPHALHMPSHTFTRVGDWRGSIEANKASAAAAQKLQEPTEELHATDYLIYAYLQTGQDAAVQRLVGSTEEVFSRVNPAVTIGAAGTPATAYFARAAIPARYCLERQAWKDAAGLKPLPSPFPQTDAITYFARGMGAARSNEAAAARLAITSLEQMRTRLTTAHETYWANQVEIERQEVGAWLAFAEGKTEEGVAGMRAAAAMEDKTEKSVVTPGPLAPARELLGELLLEQKQPAEALKEFRATLTQEPNRFRSLYGAAAAAKLAGDRQTSHMYFHKLLQVTEAGDQPGRQEVVEARREAGAE